MRAHRVRTRHLCCLVAPLCPYSHANRSTAPKRATRFPHAPQTWPNPPMNCVGPRNALYARCNFRVSPSASCENGRQLGRLTLCVDRWRDNKQRGRHLQRDARTSPYPVGGEQEARVEQLEPTSAAGLPSFSEIFQTYSAFVWRVLMRLGVARADVDDVAQEVFMSLHQSLPSFEGRCSLRTWVYGICQRRAVDYRRRAAFRPDLYAGEPIDRSADATQEHGLILLEARDRMVRVLDELDDDKRTVFVLFDIEGLAMEEVAEIIGCPLQTAYSRLYAARRKVEASLTRLRAKSGRAS